MPTSVIGEPELEGDGVVNDGARAVRWPDPNVYAQAIAGRAGFRGQFAGFEPKMKASGNRMLLPVFAAGGNAIVFRGQLDGERCGARFFTADPGEAAQRYTTIHEYLASSSVDVVAQFEWLNEVIEIGSQTYPCVLMDWIDGAPLDKALANRLDDRAGIQALTANWIDLGFELQRAQIAHGDLQHGNVLIDSDNRMRLVDLDGMWVPGLAATPSNELGHPHYQHPGRSDDDVESLVWNADLDAFSWLVIYVAMAAMVVRPTLWYAHHTGTNLLFTSATLRDPSASLWDDVKSIGGSVGRAARLLLDASQQPASSLTLDAALAALDGHSPPRAPGPGPAPGQVAWWEDDDATEWSISAEPDPSNHEFGPTVSQQKDRPSGDQAPDWMTVGHQWHPEAETGADDGIWAPDVRAPALDESQTISGTTSPGTVASIALATFAVAAIAAAVYPPLAAIVIVLGALSVTTLIRKLRTSPIVWDAQRIRIGAEWSADLNTVTVRRAGDSFTFADGPRSVKVSWMSDADRRRLEAALRSSGVSVQVEAG